MKGIIVAVATIVVGSSVPSAAQQVDVAGQIRLKGPGDGKAFTLTLPLEGKVVRGAPYSADIVTDSVQTLADGNRIVHRTTGRVYRDSEGRVRREEDRASGGPTISIIDPVAGSSFTLDAARHTAVETPTAFSLKLNEVMQKLDEQKAALATLQQSTVELQQRAMEAQQKALAAMAARGLAAAPALPALPARPALPDRPALRALPPHPALQEQSNAERLQDRVIEGVLASGVRRTTTIEKGAIGNEQPIKIVSEEWTSPDLQVLVMTDRNDPRTGRSTYRLLKINRGDPDPALFQVPADFAVQSFKASGARGRR
jgi:hypothetical protein